MINRKLTLEQRIARLEKLIKNEKHPEWSTRIITKGLIPDLVSSIKYYLVGEGARVSARMTQSNVDGRIDVTIVLHGEKYRFRFSSDFSGNYKVTILSSNGIGEDIGHFEELDEAAEAMADFALGM